MSCLSLSVNECWSMEMRLTGSFQPQLLYLFHHQSCARGEREGGRWEKGSDSAVRVSSGDSAKQNESK